MPVDTQATATAEKPKRKRAAKPRKVVTATNGKVSMSAAHKEALAEGREQGRVVRRYLDALSAHKPKRGRKRTPEAVEKRLAAVESLLPSASALDKLLLTQERLDLHSELGASDDSEHLAELEDAFVGVAAAYGSRKGLTRNAWRSAGVAPSVLTRAGIK